MWTKEEQKEAQDEYGKKCAKQKTFYEKDDDDEYAGPDMRESQLSNREMMLITKCVSFSDDLANTLLLAANNHHANHEQNQVPEDPNSTYQVQVTRPHTSLAAKVLEDIMEDATDDEKEVSFSDVYMDEDGNSIDNSDASDGNEEVTEIQSNHSDKDSERDGSYRHIMKQNVFNFLQETDMSPYKTLRYP